MVAVSDQKDTPVSDTKTLHRLSDYTGNYGPEWDQVGILSEHLVFVDCEIKVLGNGRPIAISPDGKTARILCSELVEVYTEDGTTDGRCGLRVESKDDFACPGHQRAINEYRALPEFERARLERVDDGGLR